MNVGELCEALGAKAIVMPSPEREITGAYVGDLLSWVMGRAEADSAWVTIMSNINVIAVASLSGVSCVVFSEGVTPDEDAVRRAETQEINLISVDMTSYEVCAALSKLI